MGSFAAGEVHAVHFLISVCSCVSPVSSPRALMHPNFLACESFFLFFKLGCLFLRVEKEVAGKCEFSLVMFWPF